MRCALCGGRCLSSLSIFDRFLEFRQVIQVLDARVFSVESSWYDQRGSTQYRAATTRAARPYRVPSYHNAAKPGNSAIRGALLRLGWHRGLGHLARHATSPLFLLQCVCCCSSGERLHCAAAARRVAGASGVLLQQALDCVLLLLVRLPPPLLLQALHRLLLLLSPLPLLQHSPLLLQQQALLGRRGLLRLPFFPLCPLGLPLGHNSCGLTKLCDARRRSRRELS